MVLVRRIHNRGANIVVEAHGEVLFAPSGDVAAWKRRFSHKVRDFSAAYAPNNKRPRWGHYGKPLKTTFTASTTYQPGRMKIYSAVGSTSPHAYYVDQGTGVFAGNGPYQAKILPPWERGSASLYESTWIPGGPQNGLNGRVRAVMIKGQEGQGFFDKGLKRAFQFMRMRSAQVPSEGQITQAMASFPEGLANFSGNTPSNGAFRQSLREWRAWRDLAFKKDEELGRDHKPGRKRSTVAIERAANAKALRDAAAQAVQNQRDYEFNKAAAELRADEQRQQIAEEKARRAKAKVRKAAEAAEKRRLYRLETLKVQAKVLARKYVNEDYKVTLRTIKSPDGTQYIGYDLLITSPSGQHDVIHFR